jgi:hypothetical protein
MEAGRIQENQWLPFLLFERHLGRLNLSQLSLNLAGSESTHWLPQDQQVTITAVNPSTSGQLRAQ